MIVNDQSTPVDRMSLPEPVRHDDKDVNIVLRSKYVVAPCEGWKKVLVCGTSGQLWQLDFSATARPQVRATGIKLPAFGAWSADYAADRVAIVYADQELRERLNVFDLSDGRLLLRCDASLNEACLTPDGRHLVRFKDEITEIWRLDEAPGAPQTTTLFHAPAIDDYSPHEVAHVTVPQGQGAFHFVVGHFGFVVDYTVGRDRSGRLTLVAEPRIIYEDIIYDPVQVSPGNRYPFVALDHGGGSGLKVLDVAAGTTFECPDMPESPPHSYAWFRQSIPHRHRREMLVKTKIGWGLWKFGASEMTPLCSLDIEPLHFAGDSIWAIRADDPVTLLRYTLAAGT